MFWMDMLIVCFSPVLVLLSLVALFQWVLDRVFGEAGNDVGFVQQTQADFFQKADVFAERKSRKSKTSPHYDEFVDTKHQAQHIEATEYNCDSEKEYSFADLLGTRKKV